jgi:hypothetical protein
MDGTGCVDSSDSQAQSGTDHLRDLPTSNRFDAALEGRQRLLRGDHLPVRAMTCKGDTSRDAERRDKTRVNTVRFHGEQDPGDALACCPHQTRPAVRGTQGQRSTASPKRHAYRKRETLLFPHRCTKINYIPSSGPTRSRRIRIMPSSLAFIVLQHPLLRRLPTLDVEIAWAGADQPPPHYSMSRSPFAPAPIVG